MTIVSMAESGLIDPRCHPGHASAPLSGLAIKPIRLAIQFDRQLEERLSDIRRILPREVTASLRTFPQSLRFGHDGSPVEPRPFIGTRPLRVGLDAFVFLAGFALGLRISRLDLFCPLAMTWSFRGYAVIETAVAGAERPAERTLAAYRRKVRRRGGPPVRSTFSR